MYILGLKKHIKTYTLSHYHEVGMQQEKKQEGKSKEKMDWIRG